jgi:hypothetical protein
MHSHMHMHRHVRLALQVYVAYPPATPGLAGRADPPRARETAFPQDMNNGEFGALIGLFTPVWRRYPSESNRVTTRRTHGDIVLSAPDRRAGPSPPGFPAHVAA